MTVNAAQATVKTVADPNAAYESLKPLWEKARAVCSGERFVKELDGIMSIGNNLLIPFSPSMSQEQYSFYKMEAEFPGVTAQYSKTVVGGLLRKQPTIELPGDVDEGAMDWILNQFGKDDSPFASFMDNALWEEIQTSRAWVFVDYPAIPEEEAQNSTDSEQKGYKPYPILHPAENIINWRCRELPDGRTVLDRVIVRGYVEEYNTNEFHPTFVETVWVHELDDAGLYRIRTFTKGANSTNVPVIAGQVQKNPQADKAVFAETNSNETILMNGERLDFIPAWPLNGFIDPPEPMLSPVIDKEIALYNKISRRNHLLYGAATYTPVISSDMSDSEFKDIVEAGLGSWVRLRQGDTADILKTPTEALQDMDRAITAGFEEMAKMGIRMLSPEVEQSGIALDIRNAAQTAQLGTLNNKVSNTMQQVVCCMVNWRYKKKYRPEDFKIVLSADFNPTPLGADWLRLATEWYQQGLIPRSIWLLMLKQNDMMPPDYDDEAGQKEITADETNQAKRQLELASKYDPAYQLGGQPPPGGTDIQP